VEPSSSSLGMRAAFHHVPDRAPVSCNEHAGKKGILAAGMLSVLVCYLVSAVLASFKGAIEPARTAVVGGKTISSK
jgi:hypothetical protein